MAFGNWMLLLPLEWYATLGLPNENDLFQKDRPSHTLPSSIFYFALGLAIYIYGYRVTHTVFEHLQLWLNTLYMFIVYKLWSHAALMRLCKCIRERFITEMWYFRRVIHHNVYRTIDLHIYYIDSVCFTIEIISLILCYVWHNTPHGATFSKPHIHPYILKPNLMDVV